MNPDDVVNRLSGPLSLRRRLATVAAGLGGLGVAAVVGSLWATEPGLPVRTHVAFGVIVAGGLAWAVFGAWVLSRRTPLFARDRVVAAWLAVAVSAVVTLATVPRGGVGVVFLLVAVVNLVRARAHRAALLRRKRELGG